MDQRNKRGKSGMLIPISYCTTKILTQIKQQKTLPLCKSTSRKKNHRRRRPVGGAPPTTAVSSSFWLPSTCFSHSRICTKRNQFSTKASSACQLWDWKFNLDIHICNLRKMKVNWEVEECCNHDQTIFLVTIGVYTVCIFIVTLLSL